MSEKLDRRTKAYRDLVMAMPKSEPTITETFGGEEFRYLPEPRCRVCSAGDMRKGLKNGAQVTNLVDTLLLYPKSIADIFATIEPMMEDWPPKAKITYKSIRTHLNKHLAWDRLAMRMMVERWAEEKGINVLDAAGRMILTHEAWLEATAHFGWNALISGQMEPSWAETQKAFEAMESIKQQAEGEYSVATLISQLNTVIQFIREEVDPARYELLLARMSGEDEQMALPEGEADDEMAAIMEEQSRLAGEEDM